MKTGDLMGGRFRLRDRLGAGGMSVVWRAHDEVLGRDVAIKVLSAGLARNPALLVRIRDEARAVARLRHPNIVDVYDYGEEPSRLPYVVMEVVAGRSLSQLLSGGPLPWRLAVLIGAQVAAALAAAHERGVVHRDVKPANVVVSGARVKLVDFGISAVSGADDRAAGELLGTPAYLAPERLEHGVVRPATDVYATGLLLYQSLTGRLPWAASTATEMLRAHRYQEPSALPRIAGLPAEVAALCRQCLSKDPARRPSAAAVATVLAAAAELDTTVLDLPAGVTGTPEPGRVRAAAFVPTRAITGTAAGGGRHSKQIAVIAAAVLLTSAGVAAATLPSDPPAPVIRAGVASAPTSRATTTTTPVRITTETRRTERAAKPVKLAEPAHPVKAPKPPKAKEAGPGKARPGKG
ncbi:serine/threonine-protein kinase [Actinoplanes sp. NPDC051861]|uniref:serine/threonine-protein kinase n=1 Tax=Actinoplanes sp. NPDC051861 TaxID=3155170 RepID=UPI00343CF6BA